MAVVAVTVAAAAPALGAEGNTTLSLGGPVTKSLRDQGVSIAPLAPARGGAQRIVLPVEAGLAGSGTTLLRHRGGVSLSLDGKTLRLKSLGLVLGKRARVTSKVGGDTIDLFRILRGGRQQVDPSAGTVKLAGLKLKLTPAAAETVTERLGLDRLRPRRAGTLSSDVSGLISAGAVTETPSEKKAAGCPLPSSAGPAPANPPPLATRPAGASDVTAATIDWHVRESFIRYIGTGEGTSVSAGATADPPVLLPGASAALSYDFHFPFAGGWIDTGADPANPADDTAAIYFSGGLRFLYSGHGIDLATSAPEIEIAGGNSRVIFSIADNGKAAERQVLVNLDLSQAGAIAMNGATHTYKRVPGAIPSGTASSVFAGFYSPGTDFGCFTVSFTGS